MKIAILGTKGIPNQYGGFEQFAEQLSVRLADRGNEVMVFNPSYHSFSENTYKNVNIVKVFCPEKLFGGAAHFLYDYSCMKIAIKRKADIILMCGYGTSALSTFLIKKQSTKVITNMDGFEWKRSKYNGLTKTFLRWFEKMTVRHSHQLVADHPVIQNYYREKYFIIPALIPYGANIPLQFDKSVSASYNLPVDDYYIVVARDEPENQIEFIISAWKESGSKSVLCIVTNSASSLKKYVHPNKITVITGLYDYDKLSSLRHFSLACIHGHTVGGTNPSLLEAMAAQSFIIAHKNPFHQEILDDNSLYFDSKESLVKTFREFSILFKKKDSIQNNLNKIKNCYQWESVTEKYVTLFKELLY